MIRDEFFYKKTNNQNNKDQIWYKFQIWQNTKVMWNFWLSGQTTPNKVDNNPENWKSSLIELWPRGNPVTKNQMYWKKT
jgi:hypothetical protein